MRQGIEFLSPWLDEKYRIHWRSLLLLTICYVVLWANMPTARLTIYAVRPTGTNVTSNGAPGEKVTWQVWEVAITNAGRAPADWYMGMMVKDSNGVEHSTGLGDWRPRGVLSPGQKTNVYAPVPSDSAALWSAGVAYRTASGALERRLSSWCKLVPKLRGLLPNGGIGVHHAPWHSTTNRPPPIDSGPLPSPSLTSLVHTQSPQSPGSAE